MSEKSLYQHWICLTNNSKRIKILKFALSLKREKLLLENLSMLLSVNFLEINKSINHNFIFHLNRNKSTKAAENLTNHMYGAPSVTGSSDICFVIQNTSTSHKILILFCLFSVLQYLRNWTFITVYCSLITNKLKCLEHFTILVLMIMAYSSKISKTLNIQHRIFHCNSISYNHLNQNKKVFKYFPLCVMSIKKTWFTFWDVQVL